MNERLKKEQNKCKEKYWEKEWEKIAKKENEWKKKSRRASKEQIVLIFSNCFQLVISPQNTTKGNSRFSARPWENIFHLLLMYLF